MNGKKIACLILVMILATISYATQTIMHMAQDTQAEVDAAADSLQDAENSARMKYIAITKYTAETTDLRKFLKTWEPIAEKLSSGQDAENAITSIIRSSGTLTLSQKLEVKESRENPLIPRVLIGTIIIQDDFAKALNLIGDLERKLPVARVTSCHLKHGDTGRSINLEVHIEVPLINLKAELSDKKKK